MKQKLSPELRFRLSDAESSAADPSRRIEIILELTGPLEDLAALGFQPRSVLENKAEGYRIVTGTIAIDRIQDLAAIEHVVYVEGPRRFGPLLNYSLPEVRANVLHTGTPARKGAGVLVGVIDSGIDWRHGAFVTPGGESRILAIWDHFRTADTAAGETAGPGGVGTIYRRPQINEALAGTRTIHTEDKNARGEVSGHGTHVAGIAAGNGRPASCCTTPGTYTGVAPESELLVVRYDYTNDEELGANIRMVDAITWILNEAGTRHVVINISQGDNLGPHDGTAAVERAIDTGVTAQAGRAIVVAAGNFAATRCHVQGNVPGNNHVDIEFNTRDKHESFAYLDLWYGRAGRLNVRVSTEGLESSGEIPHGDDFSYLINPTADADRQVRVQMTSVINGPFGRDHNVRIQIRKPSKGNIPAKKWTLRLTNPDAAPVAFHCWIERGDYAPQFLEAKDPPDGKIRATPQSTLSTPSTARRAITVANHQSKTYCCDCWPDSGIVPSSSQGPVARDAAANPKPDLAAPGLLITAPKADAANLKGNFCSCCPDACCCLYQDMTGTSMAAPHVAGAIALMLEKDPTLTRDQILQHLRFTARPRPAGETQEVWGAGKLNVEAAVNAVPDPGGGGGGPGGPGGSGGSGGGGGGGLSMRFERAPVGEWPEESPRPDLSSDSLPPFIRILRARLNALPEGERLAAAISRHFSEVRRLVNHNRRVATLWHRGCGPRMLRRLIHGAVDPDAPPSLGAPEDEAYLRRWVQLLERYGNAKLRQTLAQQGEAVFELLRTPLAARFLDPASAQEALA